MNETDIYKDATRRLFDMMMGSHLANAGGIGLADLLTRQLNVLSPAGKTNPETAPCDPIRTTYRTPS